MWSHARPGNSVPKAGLHSFGRLHLEISRQDGGHLAALGKSLGVKDVVVFVAHKTFHIAPRNRFKGLVGDLAQVDKGQTVYPIASEAASFRMVFRLMPLHSAASSIVMPILMVAVRITSFHYICFASLLVYFLSENTPFDYTADFMTS